MEGYTTGLDGNMVAVHVPHKLDTHKRYRATVVIIRDESVLLVRDKGHKHFSLPGGGFHKGETTIEAGSREVREELGLGVLTVERLPQCDYIGKSSHHKVCRATISESQQPHIRDRELAEFTWWDMHRRIPVFDHVRSILGKIMG